MEMVRTSKTCSAVYNKNHPQSRTSFCGPFHTFSYFLMLSCTHEAQRNSENHLGSRTCRIPLLLKPCDSCIAWTFERELCHITHNNVLRNIQMVISHRRPRTSPSESHSLLQKKRSLHAGSGEEETKRNHQHSIACAHWRNTRLLLFPVYSGPLRRSVAANLVIMLVPEVGVEPTLPCGNTILSRARLPVPPLRQH